MTEYNNEGFEQYKDYLLDRNEIGNKHGDKHMKGNGIIEVVSRIHWR